MAVLNCPLNPGNSGGPVLYWVNGQLKVVGVATQKHFKEILTLEEREKIEKIRESLQTSSITSVSDDDIKLTSDSDKRRLLKGHSHAILVQFKNQKYVLTSMNAHK